MLFFLPFVKVEFWKGHVYSAIWWHPQEPPLALLRPEYWHTTMTRCFTQSALFTVQLLADMEALLNLLLDQMLQAPQRRRADRTVGVWLRIPPWKKSWTFGVPLEVLPICDMVQHTIMALCHNIDPHSFVSKDEFHISWN